MPTEGQKPSADTVCRAQALVRALVRILGTRGAPDSVSAITQTSVSLEHLVQAAAGDPRFPACGADNFALLYEAGLAGGECRWDVRELLSKARKTIPWSLFIPTVTNVLLNALASGNEGSWPLAIVARKAFDAPPGTFSQMESPGRCVLGEILLRGGTVPRGKRIWNNRGLRTLLCQAALDETFPSGIRAGLLREILLGTGKRDPDSLRITARRQSEEAWLWLARNGADFSLAERYPGELWRTTRSFPRIWSGRNDPADDQSTPMEEALTVLRSAHFSGKGMPSRTPVLRFLEAHPEFLGLSSRGHRGQRIGRLAAPLIPRTVHAAALKEGYLDSPDPVDGMSVHEVLALQSTLPLDPARLEHDPRLLSMAAKNPARPFSLVDTDLMAREAHHPGSAGLPAYTVRMRALARHLLQPDGYDNSTDPAEALAEIVREACRPEMESAYRRLSFCRACLTPLEVLVNDILPDLKSARTRSSGEAKGRAAGRILETAATLLAGGEILGFPVRTPDRSGRTAQQPEGDVKKAPSRDLADFLAGTVFTGCPKEGALWLSSIRSVPCLEGLLGSLGNLSYSPGSFRRVNLAAIRTFVQGLSGTDAPDHVFLEEWLTDRLRELRATTALRRPADSGSGADEPEPFL